MKHLIELQGERLPVVLDDIPILYEDEELGEMGEAFFHTAINEILHAGLEAFVRERHPPLRACANLNLYYKEEPLYERTKSKPYVSPDLMIVEPKVSEPEKMTSYTIDKEGPSPWFVEETLSPATGLSIDLNEKLRIYALLGIGEYVLIDPSGKYLPQRLLLKRLQPDRTWRDEQDPDGGVTSQLGFRIIFDEDGQVRVVDVLTGWKYTRPDEANDEARARLVAEEMLHAEAVARTQAEFARRMAEQRLQKEREGRIKEAEGRQREAEARQREAEARQREAEARKLAEEKVLALEAELHRLRQETKEQ